MTWNINSPYDDLKQYYNKEFFKSSVEKTKKALVCTFAHIGRYKVITQGIGLLYLG